MLRYKNCEMFHVRMRYESDQLYELVNGQSTLKQCLSAGNVVDFTDMIAGGTVQIINKLKSDALN